MNQAPPSVWRNPIHFLAFGLGSGASPWAPGTAGTLAAIPLYLLIQPLALPWYAAVLLVTFVVGIYLCGKTSADMGVHDHGGIVWDEFVGYWITMFAAPPGWLWIVIGFVLFRLFDILKPWPISWADKQVAGGMGIMLDDVLAGVMALAVLQLLAMFL
ncbi:phosphatidylglycerophosphatase A [Amphritea sp. 2_MG-2023]|jgi:phosphatidylglycerophosphatase A|uniref:phosphatidylglycerophosphatase A family protein n=1 Tax=Amphritea TaxID=515417 RepID=UPI001C064E39|nr:MULTISPECIES: phosphatidylglycerophosphatase A [Amphritea]MBU2965744.1 phosphatidylglycerophosphatase A [Amphritea atlantica]MDO6417300.1 phosphatidylglycerophosphatase A [Amphritea sp. 2_MG-2023]MDX2423142.1 phosphatidylglycerophosphatase A [Amphritea sp.]